MKEALLTLNEGIAKGIRSTRQPDRNAGTLILAANLRPCRYGVKRAATPTAVQVLGATWPYPQLLRGRKKNYVCTEDTIYSLSASGVLTKELDGLTVGGPWSVAIFPEYEVFTNGVVTVHRNTTTGALEVYAGSAMPVGSYVTQVLGRLLVAAPVSWQDCDNTFVAWSPVLDINMVPDRTNRGGYIALEHVGEVLAVLPLGSHAVAYGTLGVSALVPLDDGSYGEKVLKTSGISSRTAVTGDRRVHYYVDSSGALWRLNATHELSFLGYEEYFSPALDDPLVLSYNPTLHECLISTASSHYIYSWRYKSLCGPVSYPAQGVHGEISSSAKKGMLIASPGTQAVGDSELVTDVVDFKYNGFKLTQWIELIGTIPSDTQVAVDARADRTSAWSRSSFVTVNAQGLAYVPLAGVEFRFVVKTASDITIEGINIRWKSLDKRFTRGLSSNR